MIKGRNSYTYRGNFVIRMPVFFKLLDFLKSTDGPHLNIGNIFAVNYSEKVLLKTKEDVVDTKSDFK